MERRIYALEIAEERLVCRVEQRFRGPPEADVNPLVILGYGLEEAHAQAAE